MQTANEERKSKMLLLDSAIMCETCKVRLRAIDSREVNGSVRRRRICPKCGNRITTYEIRADYFDMLIEQEAELWEL